MNKRKIIWWIAAAGGLILLLLALYQIPFIYNRLSWRLDDLKSRIVYTFRPPDEAVFVPEGPSSTATAVPLPEPTPDLDPVETQEAASAAEPTQTPNQEPTATALDLPESVILENVVYVFQNERWNYCGPANLTMALNYWGWEGDRDDVARVVKPGVNNPDLDFIQRGRSDKNVMPSEMIDFIVDYTDLNIAARYGGTTDLLKSLIANGYPVLVEKGTTRLDTFGDISWMGHYLFTTGYDDLTQEFIAQDSYIEDGNSIDDHYNRRYSYDSFVSNWQAFNYLFLVVYPPEQQDEVIELLGPWNDPVWSYQEALSRARQEAENGQGVEKFFAWFNIGTNLVKLERYEEAAEAYDRAYDIYNQLPENDTIRPYRMTWYQTWPYMAYYFSGRYQDVINLAEFTLNTISDPTLEETLYWRGRAHYALGNTALARQDLYQAVWLNPNFEAGHILISQYNFD